MFKTHLMFSFLLALILYKYFDLSPYLFIVILVLAGTLPDIDHSKSFIGRRFFIISWIANLFFGHRKLIHSLFFALFIALLIKIFFNNYYIPFIIGYSCHLLLDGLTKQGVRIFYPLKFRIYGFVKTNGIVEKMFLVVLAVANVIYIVKYIL